MSFNCHPLECILHRRKRAQKFAFSFEPVLSNNEMSHYMYTASRCNELLPSCYRIEEISSFFVCFAFIFRHMLTFIRYIEVYFTLGPVDGIRLKRISLYRYSLYRGSIPYILL